MLGSCVFPVTCSEEFELSSLQRILSGCVQSGCWALFDNSDKLTLQLMSVAAQQLQLITNSLRTLRYNRGLEYSTRGFPLTERVSFYLLVMLFSKPLIQHLWIM